jgi:Xaa-Pro aminopeptidase
LTAAFEKEKRDVTLVPSKDNLVDIVWSDQPARPCNAIYRLDEKYTGASVSSKLRRLREQLAKSGSPGTVVSQLDEVAWLLNLRGSDIPYNPVRPLRIFERPLDADILRSSSPTLS